MKRIAVCARNTHTAAGAYVPYGITHSYLPLGRRNISRPYPGCCNGRYSIYPPINDEMLSEPEQVDDLPMQRCYRRAGYTRCQLVKPASCLTRRSRCEQLANSCYAVTGFETRLERAIHLATNTLSVADRGIGGRGDDPFSPLLLLLYSPFPSLPRSAPLNPAKRSPWGRCNLLLRAPAQPSCQTRFYAV